jgi:hypothetical protein
MFSVRTAGNRSTMTDPLPHTMDQACRDQITSAAEQIARELLARDIWRTSWRVEVDGCVFKLKVEGYAKYGTERRKRQDAEREALLKEAEEAERGDP